MSNVSLNQDVVSRLASQSNAVGRLAQDSGGFAAVVAAFESKDPDAFRWVLDRLEMLPYCELICEWVRVKICVLRCFEVCGPPPEDVETPSLQQFANAAVKLASNEKLLRRVVDAVSCGDGDAYRAAIQELELKEFCHLICHWVCSIIYRRVCDVVCRPTPVPVYDAASEIRASGRVIASLVANKKAFKAISEAAVALNCETLQSSIQETGFGPNCEVICCFICLWRCVWACRGVCGVRKPDLTGVYGIEEARNFALATRQLASQPRALGDLVSAVQNRDAKTYGEIIDRFGLGPYCYQLCAWVCAGICYEFCICVCPPLGEVTPLFTKVGCYNVGPPYPNDFNANGTTVSGALAFTGTIPLIGLIPDGSAPQALKYRFTYQDYSGVSPNPNPVNLITGSMVPATEIGTLEFQWYDTSLPGWRWGSVPFWVNNPGATATIPQQFGPPLSVSVNTDTDASGWIQIPTLHDDSQGGNGYFTPAGAQGLILLDTTTITNETFDLTGASALPKLTAGETMPTKALSQKPVFQINFEAQTVATSTPVNSNSLNAIALSNTTYKYIRHPEWPGPLPPPPSPVTTSPVVLSVDILELDTGGGCTRLDDTIHVLYTAYHPYIDPGTCQVYLQGPGVGTMTTPPGGLITLPIQPNQGQVIGTGDGTTKTFTGTLTTPVLPGSVLINAGAVTGITDNGSGVISGAGVSAGSINYATGAISVTYSIAPAAGVQVLVDYNTNDSSGVAGTPFDMTGLPPCGYILWLTATLNLTSGLGCCGIVWGPFYDWIPFCTTAGS